MVLRQEVPAVRQRLGVSGEDVLECPQCHGRMKLLAMVTDEREVTRYLAHLGEPTNVPARASSRGPPYWKSTVLRRKALDEVAF